MICKRRRIAALVITLTLLLSYLLLLCPCGTAYGGMVGNAICVCVSLGDGEMIESNEAGQITNDVFKGVRGSASPEIQLPAADNGSDEGEDAAAELADGGDDPARWKEQVRRAVKVDLWLFLEKLDRKATLCGRSFFTDVRRGLPRPRLMSRPWAEEYLWRLRIGCARRKAAAVAVVG
eukprot:TRINITY_DN19281_c1_g1_i2.p1 TRINITY_DN19281_c1_g1~~TRINITY_DN19281_c1_g1_i2.p1  ORF type:complete len:178 (-),score=37.13 TRINITY_DN19281_c1_g1_i2:54-587(-)